MASEPLRPQTAREALLELRGWARRQGAARNGCEYVAAIADAGLAQTGIANYEWSDQLADRLAEAHKLLREIREGTEMATLSGEIDQALALPPDLESMVERRIR